MKTEYEYVEMTVDVINEFIDKIESHLEKFKGSYMLPSEVTFMSDSIKLVFFIEGTEVDTFNIDNKTLHCKVSYDDLYEDYKIPKLRKIYKEVKSVFLDFDKFMLGQMGKPKLTTTP